MYAGGWIGNVTCLLSTGLLAASPWGWPSCFYVWGSITIVSSILFFFIGYESPAEHPNIPQDEKQYIESSLGMIETEEVRIFNYIQKIYHGNIHLMIYFSRNYRLLGSKYLVVVQCGH